MGIYDRKFEQHYSDRNIGTTTAKRLWKNSISNKINPNDNQGNAILANCDCCHQYREWKAQHFDEYKRLQNLADESIYYQIS